MGMLLQAFRLAEQQELSKPNLIDLAHQLLARTRQDLRNPSDQLNRPVEVIGVIVLGLQRTEQCVILQPMAMKIAELLIRGLQFCVCPGAEIAPSRFEYPALERDDRVIIGR